MPGPRQGSSLVGHHFPAHFLAERFARWKSWLLFWLALCAACAALYFWDYQKPHYLPGFAPAVSPLDYIYYILVFLGSTLVCAGKYAPITVAASLGATALALFASTLVYVGRQRQNHALARRALPWFALRSLRDRKRMSGVAGTDRLEHRASAPITLRPLCALSLDRHHWADGNYWRRNAGAVKHSRRRLWAFAGGAVGAPHF